jgi:PAS domain-containing protein
MKNRQPDPTTTKHISAPTVADKSAPDTDERYRLVIEAVAEGIYEWSTKTNHLELSTRLTEMFGFEKQALLRSANPTHALMGDPPPG